MNTIENLKSWIYAYQHGGILMTGPRGRAYGRVQGLSRPQAGRAYDLEDNIKY